MRLRARSGTSVTSFFGEPTMGVTHVPGTRLESLLDGAHPRARTIAMVFGMLVFAVICGRADRGHTVAAPLGRPLFRIESLGDVRGFPETSTPTAINESRTVVGEASRKVKSTYVPEGGFWYDDYVSRAYIWQSGKLTVINAFRKSDSRAIAINDKNQILVVVGPNSAHPVTWLYSKGKAVAIRPSSGYFRGAGINDRGQIANSRQYSGDGVAIRQLE